MLKQQALDMRKDGCTYKEISDILGVKESWCKYHLKGVDTGANKYLDELKEICTVKDGVNYGVTRYKAIGVIYKYFPDVKKEKINNLIKKARDNGIMIIPNCTNLNNPIESYTDIISMSIDLRYYIDELIDTYMNSMVTGEFELPKIEDIKKELICLTFPNKEPIKQRVPRHEKVMYELEGLEY